MTQRTEALARAYDELVAAHGKVVTKEHFVCYALSALPTPIPDEGEEDPMVTLDRETIRLRGEV